MIYKGCSNSFNRQFARQLYVAYLFGGEKGLVPVVGRTPGRQGGCLRLRGIMEGQNRGVVACCNAGLELQGGAWRKWY